MDHADEPNLGVALRRLRLARGLSLDQAAQRSGTSKAALSAWETGSRRPRGPALARLLDALGADDRTKARLLTVAAPRHARIALADSPFAPVDVGAVLRVVRERRGVAQADLARRLGVSQSAVSQWESGDDVPSPETLHALGFALGASVEETLALASAAGRGGGGLPDDPEAAAAHVWAGPDFHPLRETLLLGWEAELARRAARDARWDPGLAAVLSAHACLLVGESRNGEIAPVARRALGLAATPEGRLQAVPALGALDHAERRRGRDDGATAEMAGAWSETLPDSPNRAWMLRQRGLGLVRRGRVAEGVRWIERSSDVELGARPDHPEPWSHRAEMLADAYLEAGDPRAAAAVVGGRRERCFPAHLYVRIEHANGRAVTGAEMAWLRRWTLKGGWARGLAAIAGIERRQTRLTGISPEAGGPVPIGPEDEDRLWAAVRAESPG